MLLALLIAAQTYGPQHLPPVTDSEDPLVDVAEVVSGLIVDLAYARADNIAGRALYPPDAKCWLRRSVAQRVAIAADALHKQGFRLVARDCTRSPAAQRALWRAHPHPGAVADPARGSLHARGVAIDLALAHPFVDGRPPPRGARAQPLVLARLLEHLDAGLARSRPHHAAAQLRRSHRSFRRDQGQGQLVSPDPALEAGGHPQAALAQIE